MKIYNNNREIISCMLHTFYTGNYMGYEEIQMTCFAYA